ncbi:MAG: hypothetical protein JST12_07555 [Armatimonadetes bacterium]|nr:hypothetical protein [Armatimonadota bacterium]
MKLASVSGFILLASIAFSQGTDPLGSGRPSPYTVDSLPADLVAVEVATTKDNLATLMGLSMSQTMISSHDSVPNPFSREFLMSLMDVIWIGKGEEQGNSEYLIGYKLDVSRVFLPSQSQGNSFTFRLTYVRRQAIVSLTPREDLAPTVLRDMMKTPVQAVGTVTQRTATLSNLKQVATALAIFEADYDDRIPYVESTPQLFDLLNPYIKNREVFKTLNPAGGMFRLNMSLAGTNADEIPNPAGTVLFYESLPWADGRRCVAFVDMHAKVVDEAEWQSLQPTLNLKLKRYGKPLKPGQLPPSTK